MPNAVSVKQRRKYLGGQRRRHEHGRRGERVEHLVSKFPGGATILRQLQVVLDERRLRARRRTAVLPFGARHRLAELCDFLLGQNLGDADQHGRLTPPPNIE